MEPLRREATWTNPRVVMVIDPVAYNKLHDDQKQRLEDYLARKRLNKVESLDELKQGLTQGQPRLLYWFGNSRPECLLLGNREIITPRTLEDELIRSAKGDRSQGMLIFLNACQTGGPVKRKDLSWGC